MDLNPQEEIKIAQFWRGLVGDYGYSSYDPGDLRRWYLALEQRGPDEIREYINERQGRGNWTHLQGLVSVAPHPPMPLVNLWLDSHMAESRSAPYWYGLVVFVVLTAIGVPFFQGCQVLKDPNTLIAKPGLTDPILLTGSAQAPPSPGAAMPQNLTPPANDAGKRTRPHG